MIEGEPLPVAAARAGDPAAWDVLFRRYQLPLYAYAAELLRHEQASLDVVQETFISAARHLGGLREDAIFGSWLFGIAHQKCVQHWRRERRFAAIFDHPEELPDEHAASDGEASLRAEEEAELMSMLDQLAPAHRSVLLLHYLEEFSLEQIAAITGTPAGTV